MSTSSKLCDTLHPDDGAPMRQRERGSREHRRSRKRKEHRKRAQLRAQTERSVVETLAIKALDLELLDLQVHSVTPNPDTDHFLVTVSPQRPSPDVDFQALQARLDAFAPVVRSELARDISRKRTPFVSFLVLPREALA